MSKGEKQSNRWNQKFRDEFKPLFGGAFSVSAGWSDRQDRANSGALASRPELLLPGRKPLASEAFELGDLRINLRGWTLIVEYDRGAVSIHNLVKHWPFIRGELTATQPLQRVMIVHFSSFWSYASYRHLWEWVMARMQEEARARGMELTGHQFDHCAHKTGLAITPEALTGAIDWLRSALL